MRYGLSVLFLLLACVTTPPATPPVALQPPAPPAALQVELASQGSLQDRLSPADDSDLVIFYGAEQSGDLGPCGCPSRPRGGLARMASYSDATNAQAGASPAILVNSGQWLEDAVGIDGNPRADVATLNRWMIKGQLALAPDALNVSTHDMAGLSGLGSGGDDLPLVSANVSGPGIEPMRFIKRGDLTIAITGITKKGMTLLQTPGYEVREPYSAALDVIDGLDVDLVVLLSYHAREAAKKLAEEGRVDVVIDAQRHRTLDEPGRIGGALWIRSHFQTLRLGELRLRLNEGKIHTAMDRKIDTDEALGEERTQAAIYREARKELRVIEKQLYGEPRK